MERIVTAGSGLTGNPEAAPAADPEAAPASQQEDAAAGDDEAHRVDLPDGSGEWALWRCACLRGAGFPISEVLRLASPPAAAAADALRAREDEAEQCRKTARDALSREIERAPRGALDGLVKAVQQLKKGRLPGVAAQATLPAAARAALERSGAADEATRHAGEEYLACFSAETERLAGELRDVARDGRFREAVLWQNRHVLETGIDRLAREAGGRAPSKQRQHQQVVASYLQRFCTKNDTIGFFGPVGWATLGLGKEPIAVHQAAGFLVRRRVFFEGWCVDAVADALCADRSLLLALAPRRSLFVRADGEVFGGAPRPAPERRALLAQCDGETPAFLLAERLVAAGTFPGAAAVYATLLELRAARLLTWSFDLPVVLEPERALAQQIERLQAGEARDAARQRLAELEACRRTIAQAAGDDRTLEAALRQMERCFTGLTGLDPTRAQGEAYAGRCLVYEDCRRGADLVLGADVLAALAPPLSLLLTAARWLTWTAAEIYRGRFQEAYRQLRQATGSQRIDLASFCRSALPPLFDPRTSPVGRQILPQFWRRWAAVLGRATDAGREVTFTSAELRPRVLDAFAAPGPGWTTARHHSPDLLIAASGPEAIRRGDYRFVLGELHTAANTLSTNLFVAQHPAPGDLIAAMARDVPEPCVFPTLPKLWRQEESDALLGIELPGISGRLDYGLATAKDLFLEVTPAPPGIPRKQVLSVAELFVEPGEGGLVVVGRDGSRFDLLDFLQTALKLQITTAFKIFPPSPHLPRVTVDRLIFQRESWALAAAAMDFARAATAAQRFANARRWADGLGLPRLVFVKAPHERKPFFVDFASPLSVEIFAREVRRAREEDQGKAHLAFSEMLPGPEESWLPDAAGRHYTSELRLVAFDRSGGGGPPTQRQRSVSME